MKIGILTQPLYDNYGGLLQAYALKEALMSLGHDVVIINRQSPTPKKWRLLASKIKKVLQKKHLIHRQYLSKSQMKTISKNTIAFREKYIPEQSKLIDTNKKMKLLNNEGFDVFIVGSDQCWRPIYSPQIKNYFLDFAKKNIRVKRVSYAASFGTSEWEFSKKQTKKCKNLLKQFDAISVREESGVKLVQKYLGREDAVQVLDPTMLLQKSHYLEILHREKMGDFKEKLKVYVLDKTSEKSNFIKQVESLSGFKMFEVMPKERMQNKIITDCNINDFQYPSPLEWLKGFQDAEFVVTDSFHGTLFSILFNIPFIALGNVDRGMARFESLLKMFGLSNRLVTEISKANLDDLLNERIDWSFANQVLENERSKALDFLVSSLKQ